MSTTLNPLPVINIDALRRDVARIVVDGEEHIVKQITGIGYHTFRNANSDDEKMAAHYQIVGDCVPSLPATRVQQMTVGQLQRIIELACEVVDQIEASAPNG